MPISNSVRAGKVAIKRYGIACLRAETTWMQAHLVQLEAAQVHTKTFYDVWDSNQKTIFDLFWHVMYRRVSGSRGE